MSGPSPDMTVYVALTGNQFEPRLPQGVITGSRGSHGNPRSATEGSVGSPCVLGDLCVSLQGGPVLAGIGGALAVLGNQASAMRLAPRSMISCTSRV